MPSPPSASADHFAAVEADILADSRLGESKRRLLVRSVRRARSDYGRAADLFQQLVAVWLRAYWKIVAAPPDVVTTLRGLDGLTRLAGRIGLLRPGGLRGMRSVRLLRKPPTTTYRREAAVDDRDEQDPGKVPGSLTY